MITEHYHTDIDYYMAIARGLDGHSVVNIYGDTPDYVYPEEDTKMKLSSGEVTIEGLDANCYEMTELVQAGDVVEGYYRINRMESTTDNAEDIRLESGENVYCEIEAGKGQSNMGLYTVPCDCQGYVIACDGGLWVREDDVFLYYGHYQMKFPVPIRVDGCSDIRTDRHVQVILVNNS